jgi:lysophospholipase L1-like esterase
MKKNIKKYYLFGDGIHFSDKGHKLIADFLIDSIQK